MKTTEMTITVLEAPEGAYLTQSNLEEGAERTFVTKVFLAQESTAAEWREATAEERGEYEQLQQENTDENNLQ